MSVNLLDYFNLIYYWKDDKPIIKLHLKDEFKLNKSPLFKSSGQPISGAEEKYYINYLGDHIGKIVYAERRKLFAKNRLILWLIDNIITDDDEKQLLLDYVNTICNKISFSLNDHYSSPAGEVTREKLRKRSAIWSPILGKRTSDRWKDPIWKSNYIQKNIDNGVYERNSLKQKKNWEDVEFRTKQLKILRSADRCKKISDKAKEMWVYVKEYDIDKYYRMINSAKSKKYILNGVYMNSIEYLVGILLNDMNLEYSYESLIQVNNNTYQPDFSINGTNILIECYGNFWHANPKYFNESQCTHKSRSVLDVWKYDKLKKENLESIGYVYIILWEDDILSDINICKKIIQQHI